MTLTVLRRSDTGWRLVCESGNPSGPAESLSWMQAFDVSLELLIPSQEGLLTTVRRELADRHLRSAWYDASCADVLEAIVKAMRAVEAEQEDKPKGEGGAPTATGEGSHFCTGLEAGSPRDSVEEASTQSEAEGTEHQCASEGQGTSPSDAGSNATPDDAADGADPAFASITPCLLTPCPRNLAPTAASLRRDLFDLVGKSRAVAALSGYRQISLRVDGVCKRFLVNSSGETVCLGHPSTDLDV
jgi:hypothetical protein